MYRDSCCSCGKLNRYGGATAAAVCELLAALLAAHGDRVSVLEKWTRKVQALEYRSAAGSNPITPLYRSAKRILTAPGWPLLLLDHTKRMSYRTHTVTPGRQITWYFLPEDDAWYVFGTRFVIRALSATYDGRCLLTTYRCKTGVLPYSPRCCCCCCWLLRLQQ